MLASSETAPSLLELVQQQIMWLRLHNPPEVEGTSTGKQQHHS